MKPQAYKVTTTRAHEISVWTVLSRLLHSRDPHLGGTNGDVQYDLGTLVLPKTDSTKTQQPTTPHIKK